MQVTLADGNIVQAAQLATLAIEMVDNQGVVVLGILAMKFYILNTLPA